MQKFEDLEVWKLARKLVVDVYQASKTGAFAKDFGFKDQICRASVSIISNIAEGFERHSSAQFLHFLDIVSGSIGEVRAQLYVALDLGYLSSDQFQCLLAETTQIGKMITSLKRHLRSNTQ